VRLTSLTKSRRKLFFLVTTIFIFPAILLQDSIGGGPKRKILGQESGGEQVVGLPVLTCLTAIPPTGHKSSLKLKMTVVSVSSWISVWDKRSPVIVLGTNLLDIFSGSPVVTTSKASL